MNDTPKNPITATTPPIKLTREDLFLLECVREEARDPGAVGRALTWKNQAIEIVSEPPGETRRKRRLAKIAADKQRPTRRKRRAFPHQAYLDGIASYDPYTHELTCV